MSAGNNPFETIERMFEQMSRQFEEAARAWGTEGADLERGRSGRMGIDIADHGEEFVVTADVPGFESDEIDLRIADTTLLIEATHEQTAEEEAETYLRSERERRSLREQVRLPDSVVEDEVDASLNNGVLTVRLPKAEPTEAGGRRIDID